MKQIILPAIVVIAIILYFGLKTNDTKPQTPAQPKEKKMTLQFPGILPDNKIKNKQAIISTGKGKITIELYADKAPKSVSNFIYLVENKFYDGLTFHRVEPGFVIQGGDPKGDGTGGPGYQWPDEPVKGEYKTGTMTMANAGPDTNGSQFFICLDNLPQLPKQYNLFGQVTAGMDVAKKIQVGDKIDSITIANR